jgi:hypothetical protein
MVLQNTVLAILWYSNLSSLSHSHVAHSMAVPTNFCRLWWSCLLCTRRIGLSQAARQIHSSCSMAKTCTVDIFPYCSKSKWVSFQHSLYIVWRGREHPDHDSKYKIQTGYMSKVVVHKLWFSDPTIYWLCVLFYKISLSGMNIWYICLSGLWFVIILGGRSAELVQLCKRSIVPRVWETLRYSSTATPTM